MTKNWLTASLAVLFTILSAQSVFAQQITTPSQNNQLPPAPRPSSTPKLSSTLTKNYEKALAQSMQIPRERREQALAKLLEGQRYIWGMSRLRTQAGVTASSVLAKQALQKSIELDPNLSESYTALAEIVLTTPPYDIDEAIALADLAVRINPDNFGARKILARIHTIKSGLTNPQIDSISAQKAIIEWKQITRLDPRNAEAWAFLSEFYERTNRTEERIDALQKWIGSASPIETRFYRTILNRDLSVEDASLRLGEALLRAGREREAVEILSQAVADDPENTEAIELLRQAIENADTESSANTIQSLQQAVFANPTNLALIELLAQVQSRSGKTDEATRALRGTIAGLLDKDSKSAANLQISLGDVLAEANRGSEAIAAYEDALKIQGIGTSALNTDEDREFALRVFEKMISAHKNAGRVNEARATINRARVLLGNNDIFADKQLISLLSETGNRQEALQIVRAARAKTPGDYSLLRLEASLLNILGKTDEAIALIKPLIGKGKTLSAPSLMYDDFSNYIFISSLYSQARRGKEAIAAARQAYAAAEGEERKQIANLSLATAQQQAGDFRAAEGTLRDLLRQNPGNPIALNNLGYFLLEREERFNEALKLIEQAVAIDPTNSSYLDSLGWAYFKLGNLAEAERYLKLALRYNPSSATINEHLGDVYHKQNKLELAVAAWRRALTLSSDAVEIARLKSKLTQNVSQR